METSTQQRPVDAANTSAPTIDTLHIPQQQLGEESIEEEQTSLASPTSTLGRPQLPRSPHSNPNFSSLPPLVTSSPAPPSSRPPNSMPAAVTVRKPSYATKRLSTFSNSSAGLRGSRPQSTVFPMFHSSLPFALVRDFAYAPYHPMHYGPPPDGPSGASTPAEEIGRRLSDPAPQSWSTSKIAWSADPGGGGSADAAGTRVADLKSGGVRLPATSFGDGPPYVEDEDLLSPIVTTSASSKHKKSRSSAIDYFTDASNRSGKVPSYTSNPTDDYYSSNQQSAQNGQDFAHSSYTLQQRHQHAQDNNFAAPTSHTFARNDEAADEATYNEAYSDEEEEYASDDEESSRLSRHYAFHIASPDEEFHGKAVALFDFARENENELPLVEGQVIWVSYRHGQGWLVAQDPKSLESGLVPEAYVRLVKDIEGGLKRLNGIGQGACDAGDATADPADRDDTAVEDDDDFDMRDGGVDVDTPTTSPDRERRGSSSKGGGAGYYEPVMSSFSTSSKDLERYPLATASAPAGTGTTSQVTTPKASQAGFAHFHERLQPHEYHDENDDDDDGP